MLFDKSGIVCGATFVCAAYSFAQSYVHGCCVVISYQQPFMLYNVCCMCNLHVNVWPEQPTASRAISFFLAFTPTLIYYSMQPIKLQLGK